MVSRFQNLMLSDSDEDKTDKVVIERREVRSNGADSARAAGTTADAATLLAPALQLTRPMENAVTSVRRGTQHNDSVASSKRILLESSHRTGPQAAATQSGPTESTSIDFNVDQMPRRIRGGFVRHIPEDNQLREAMAPKDDPTSSINFAMDEPSQRGVALAAKGTPRESIADSTNSDGHKKNPKIVRRKVVVRRRKDADPNAPGEVTRADGDAIPPGRQAGAVATANNGQVHFPLPPSRVSPRARHAAASRSASRANSPAENPYAPGGGLRATPPPIPVSRANSRAATPLIAPRSSRHATPRSSAENTAHADMPIAFEVTPDTATSNTINFHVEDAHAHTDDTISFQFDDATTPRWIPSRDPSYPDRHPQIPSPSALVDSPTPIATDDNGQKVMLHRAKVRLTKTAEGRQAWMLFSPRKGDSAAAPSHEIPAPPKRLSQRAQEILASKRRAVEADVKKRHAAVVKHIAGSELTKGSVFFEEEEGANKSTAASESELQFESAPLSENQPHHQQAGQAGSVRRPRRLSIARHTRVHFDYPCTAFYSETAAQQHTQEAQAANELAWTRHTYDAMSNCAVVARASGAATNRRDSEKVVRTLQPVQVAPTEGATGTCSCVVYDEVRDDALRQLISNSSVREEGMRRYLNLQPMQLASVEMQDIVDPPLESPAESGSISETNQRGVATLGGLWCTAETLRADGRPATRKDAAAPRRILRVCGGQALGVPLKPQDGTMLDVRCYELLLFPRESLSLSAVNYGSEGLTLGQLIAPPASSFPLTPRIVDDPLALKEYKKRLLSTKNRQIAMVNNEDDRETFAVADKVGRHYLTLTMVTISSRQKYTIELTLVLLPFRSNGIFGGKTVAEVPRFCPTTVMTYRRLQGLALSFSTKYAFMSAYKALLWATECDIVDVLPSEDEDAASAGLGYSTLRVCATSSPMVPWVSSFGHAAADKPREETYHGNCLDFAVLMLAAPPEAIQKTEPSLRDPLTLEDFVIVDKEDGNGGNIVEEGSRSVQSGAAGQRQRRSSIFTSTLAPSRKVTDDNEGANAASRDTVVGLTAYGVIRRAVSQKTSEVFDVRVMPRNRGRMAPTWDAAADVEWREAGGQTVKSRQEHLLQQDVEAAIMIEYASRLPFHSRVYGILVDEQRYYIFQEPLMSALALEQSVTGSVERDAIEYNEKLKNLTQSTSVMSLKDFTHAILCPSDDARGMLEEVKLQLAHILAAQLLLLITSLHGKGMLLGPCPPQRILVRIDNASKEDTTDRTKKQRPAPQKVQSGNIQLFVPDLGVNSLAWGYERQQCGVLEYLPPLYVLEQMLSESIGKEGRAWTIHDDWWTYLTLCFELFAGDGTALVTPKKSAPVPTPTPTLTKFFSPVDILDVWQEVVSDSSDGVAGTAVDTVGVRVRRYVHQRVLRSVSRQLDSWISTKAEELEYFGTTAAQKGRRVVRAVPTKSVSQGHTIGVSLAAAYLASAREMSEASSVAFQSEDGEGGDAESVNVLEDMPWVFQVRDFFDTILDAVFACSSCSVHGPSLRLVSHPFFRTVSLPDIFDGTFVLSPAASHFAVQQMTKPKLQAALLAYRVRAHRGPMASRPEIPLMITGSAYNTAGGANSAAPLLMFSSTAYQKEQNAREQNDGAEQREAGVGPAEDLVFSRTNSTSQGMNAAASPHSQSPAAGQWSQQRLRAMYDPTEWQSIAALETEVRGALNMFGPREFVSSSRASAVQDDATRQVTISNRPVQPTHRDTASNTSSGRRHDPREYEQVVDSRPNVRPVRRAASCHAHENAIPAPPPDTYDTAGVPVTAEKSLPLAQTSPQGTYNSHPAYSRDGHQPASDAAPEREAGHRSPRDAQQHRHARYHSRNCCREQNLKNVATRHAHMQQNNKPRRHRRGEGVGATSSGYDTGYSDSQQPQEPRPASRHSSPPHSWPEKFLEAATLQKKGQPRRLADPQNLTVDLLNIDAQTQQSLRSLVSHNHHSSSITHNSENVCIFHESSSEESYVLVPSDDEVYTAQSRGSFDKHRGVNRESPVPRNPRESRNGAVAFARENHFEC